MVKDIPKMGVLKGPSAKFSNPFCHIVESHGLIDGTKATTDVHHAICMILPSPHGWCVAEKAVGIAC